MNFFDKLNQAIAHHQSLLYLSLDPDPEAWMGEKPDRDAAGKASRSEDSEDWLQGDRLLEPLLEPSSRNLQDWLQQLIDETADLVCAYKVNPALYQVMGVSGLKLLEWLLQAIPSHLPVILDAKHGDLNSSTVYARKIFLDWQVDAVTLNPYAGQDQAAPFLVYPDKMVFLLCTTTNPSARALQDYPSPESPFYLHLMQEGKTWGTPEQVGLEVGAATPEMWERIRAAAPERLILARSVWTETSDLTRVLDAGLNRNGNGLLIPVSPEVVRSEGRVASIQTLRDDVNRRRDRQVQGSPNCDIWMPDVCLLKHSAHEDLILQLFDVGCLQFGEYVQASGATFSYYIDLRRIISNPQVFEKVINAYADILKGLVFDRIAGIPYGALPTATGLALRLNAPMIFPRKEVKAHGTRRLVEGNFHTGETAVVVDDVLITGNSAIEGAQKLQSVGLNVQDIVVLIDHEKGVKDALQAKGYQGHAVLRMSEIIETLYEARRINDEQFSALKDEG